MRVWVSRLHVEQVPDGHVGVGLAAAVALSEQLLLGPGHVHARRRVAEGGVGRRVPVVDQLGLRARDTQRDSGTRTREREWI